MASADAAFGLRDERAKAQKQLDAYAVLDTPPEPEFDDLTEARRRMLVAQQQPTSSRRGVARRLRSQCATWNAR